MINGTGYIGFAVFIYCTAVVAIAGILGGKTPKEAEMSTDDIMSLADQIGLWEERRRQRLEAMIECDARLEKLYEIREKEFRAAAEADSGIRGA